MPNCFQLFRKGSAEPELLNVIDAEFCSEFNIVIHDKNWGGDSWKEGSYNWFDNIGFLLAMRSCPLGSQEFRDEYKKFIGETWNETDDQVLTWFEKNFESSSFAYIGKR